MVHLRQGYGVHGNPPLAFAGFGLHGRLTEWLGSGLQNRVRRFDSATDLNKILHCEAAGDYFLYPT
jgi:hypothetical protein